MNGKQFGCGSVDCGDGTRIDVHMANNAGRGSDNVTLTRVAATVEREMYTRDYDAGAIIGRTRTSGWRGSWTLTKAVQAELGLRRK